MQTQKANIRSTIIEVARKSFFENGYRKTAMRSIAKDADVTLSNIYNYFKNKDEILEVILQPVFAEFEEMFDHYEDETSANCFEVSDVTEIDDFEKYTNFIITYQKELDLLFHKCSGSKYENIKDQLIDRYTETSKDYLKLMKEKHPQINENISIFFIHTVAGWWVQIMSEIVSHNLSKEEILKFNKEYITFSTGGWKRLLNL